MMNESTDEFKLLNVRIDQKDRPGVEQCIREMLSGNTLSHIATVNPEFLVEANTNEKFQNILNTTRLNVCDGYGIEMWSKLLYKQEIPRITGVELADTICRIAADMGKSVAFLGGFGVADNAAEVMQSKYPNLKVALYEDGSPDEASQDLKNAKPDVVLVAFGAPKQAYWIRKYAPEVPSIKLAIGVGGTFDFWAKVIPRAPQWMQKVGLEWLWRLILQPSRWKRIYRAVFVFSWLVVRDYFKRSKE